MSSISVTSKHFEMPSFDPLDLLRNSKEPWVVPPSDRLFKIITPGGTRYEGKKDWKILVGIKPDQMKKANGIVLNALSRLNLLYKIQRPTQNEFIIIFEPTFSRERQAKF